MRQQKDQMQAVVITQLDSIGFGLLKFLVSFKISTQSFKRLRNFNRLCTVIQFEKGKECLNKCYPFRIFNVLATFLFFCLLDLPNIFVLNLFLHLSFLFFCLLDLRFKNWNYRAFENRRRERPSSPTNFHILLLNWS